MSAAPKIIEGTWEEISRHADELAGHRLQVIVLDEPDPRSHPGFDTSSAAVQAWADRFRKWAYDRAPLPIADDSRDAIYEDYLK